MSKRERIEMTDLLWDVFMDNSFYTKGSPGPGYIEHAGTPTVNTCIGFFKHNFSFTCNVPHSCCWKLVVILHRGLIDSAAESANYISTCDNHMVGAMSCCGSNESSKPPPALCTKGKVAKWRGHICGTLW